MGQRVVDTVVHDIFQDESFHSENIYTPFFGHLKKATADSKRCF